MTTTEESVPPVVCTLSSRERAERGLEWSDLAALSLTSEHIEGGVVSTFPLSLADKIDDLANRETNCCGTWLDVSATRLADVVRLELTTSNPDGLAMIMSIAGAPTP
jgi:hypothetical protein